MPAVEVKFYGMLHCDIVARSTGSGAAPNAATNVVGEVIILRGNSF